MRVGDNDIEVGSNRQGKYYEMPNAHLHPVYEIYYLNSGTRKFFIEDEIYYISKGDLVLINKNVMHKTTYSSDSANERTYILFNDNHITETISACGRDELEQCFKQKIFSIPVQRREYVEGLISKMYGEYKNYDNFSKQLIRFYLNELIIFLVRYNRYIKADKQKTNVLGVGKTSDEMIQKAAKYIVENYHKNINLKGTADFVNMSSTYFSKKFKEVTGFGFKEYLINIRIKKACELLLDTKKSVTDIAYETGFNDSNYFGDVFKKSKGISPLQYRKNREYI